MVVENRRVLTVDLARLRDRAEAARDRLAAAQRRQPPPLRGAGAGRRQLLPGSRAPRRTTSTATARISDRIAISSNPRHRDSPYRAPAPWCPDRKAWQTMFSPIFAHPGEGRDPRINHRDR